MLRPDLLSPDVARRLFRLNVVTACGAGLCLLMVAALYTVAPSAWVAALAGLNVWSGAAALTYCQRYRAHAIALDKNGQPRP